MTGVASAVLGALVTAAVSTAGDYLWANVIPHHEPIYGLSHGVVLFLTVGACLGAASGKPALGAFGAALIGFIAAGSWYVLQPFIGYATAMFVLWFGLWAMLGVLTVRVLQGRPANREVLARSGLAACGSAVAFYAVSGIWFPFNPQGWDYAVHFVSWTIAYLPAFAALLIARREKGSGVFFPHA